MGHTPAMVTQLPWAPSCALLAFHWRPAGASGTSDSSFIKRLIQEAPLESRACINMFVLFKELVARRVDSSRLRVAERLSVRCKWG